ncbi:hypothetical protein WMO79_05595 [Micrococcaceae bacterium Sec7.4]
MRRAASIATTLSAFCAASVLAACGSPAAAPATSSPPTATATVNPSPSAATSPAVTVPAGWKTFTTSDGTLAFDYPESWTIKDPADEPAEGGIAVDLVSDYGKTMASLRTNMVAGAECPEKFPFMMYDSEPVPALAQGGVIPRFVYEGRSDPASSDPAGSLTLAYGITSEPEPTGDAACPISHFFTWPPSGAIFGGAYNPFDTTPGGPTHVDTPEVYKDTTEYKYVKQAITSLRPAGKQ